jgi:hypothetical protein
MDVTTPILAKWKEKWPEYFLTGLAGLVALLLTTIWLEVGATIWERVSTAISNKVLLASLGLAIVVICLLTAYIFHQRRVAKFLQTEIENFKSAPKPKRPRFNVIWDENAEPFCPVHQDVHLGNWIEYMANHRIASYHCPASGHYVPLKDDDGRYLTPKEAKALLRGENNPPSNKRIEPTPR